MAQPWKGEVPPDIDAAALQLRVVGESGLTEGASISDSENTKQ